MEIDLSRFRETFFQETAEHLETMESGLLSLQAGAADAETVNSVFRGAHSIKGGAATFGLETISRFTHVVETVLDRIRNGELQITEKITEQLLRSVDILRALVDPAMYGSDECPPGMEGLMSELSVWQPARTAKDGSAKPAPAVREQNSGEVEYDIRFEPQSNLFQLGLDPILVLRELATLGRVISVKADLSRLPPLDALDPDICYLGWHLSVSTPAPLEQIRDVFAFVEDVALVSIQPIAKAAALTTQKTGKTAERNSALAGSIRVSTGKVDRLIDLVGELVIAQSMATEIMADFTPESLQRLQEAMADVGRYTLELQDRAMRIRMLPIGSVFSRFPRMVHDAAQSLGKQVELRISGEETELDKGVVEQIADPLTHLIRNAVDHGIDAPEQRQRAGKPAQGQVSLRAYHQGGSVIIEVADDGRGLDTARIRAKAIERGIVAANDELSAEEIYGLIFRPGFSTADTVTAISGRGVGMDAVKKSVDALHGTVTLESLPGKGTLVRIKLPLTLAILDALLLRVGDQRYVLPLVSIVESIQPRREQVRSLAGNGEVITLRKEPVPLVRLHQLFHIPTEVTDATRGLVVIVEHQGLQLALLVDEILGQQQVVVKSLETNFRKVEGITGATILGDGRAALILDVAGIVQMSRADSPAAAA